MAYSTHPVPSIQITQAVPDSPSGTVPSTHSGSDWQSIHSSHSQQSIPTLILDASCPLITQCKSADIPALLHQLRCLAIPITTFDATPDTQGNTSNGFESKLGTLKDSADIAIGTKVNTRGSRLGVGAGELHAHFVRESLVGSMKRTRRQSVDWLIAQRPDCDVSLGEVTGGFEALLGEGMIGSWGVREFRSRQLRDLLMTCRRRGYVGPTIYQGEYNLLCRRSIEARMPLIREHNMVVHAYEPFAKGALSKPLEAPDTAPSQSTAWRSSQYDTHEMTVAIENATSIAGKYDMSTQSAALRWLAFHSNLGQADGIIIGASSIEELEEKITALVKGPLPEEVIGVLERVGDELRDGRPVTPE